MGGQPWKEARSSAETCQSTRPHRPAPPSASRTRRASSSLSSRLPSVFPKAACPLEHVSSATRRARSWVSGATSGFRRTRPRCTARPTASRTLADFPPTCTGTAPSTPPCRLARCGTVLLYGIPRVVMGENETFVGGEDWLKHKNVEIVNVDSQKCKDLMSEFIRTKPEVWNEDIGED